MVIKPTFYYIQLSSFVCFFFSCFFLIDHNLCPYVKIPHYLSRKFSQFQSRSKASPLNEIRHCKILIYLNSLQINKWIELRLNVIVLTRAKSSASFSDEMSLELCTLALLVSAIQLKQWKTLHFLSYKSQF